MSPMRRLLATALVCSIGGCAPWATYPPIEKGTPIASGELPPFPRLMAEAIWHVNVEFGDGTDQFAYNLPPGTTSLVYEKVQRRLGVGHPQRDASTPAIHVQSVRARGFDGEVDVVYPRADGHYELVTVKLRNEPFEGWQVKSDRRWRFAVEPPPPSYVPPREDDEAVANVPDE